MQEVIISTAILLPMIGMVRYVLIRDKQQARIGIIGGVGAFAGLELNKKIFQLSGARSDQEYPEVYLLTAPFIPDRSTYLLNQKTAPNPSKAIITVVAQLSQLQVKILGIPCNTAHAPLILDPVLSYCRAHNMQMLHMINATAAYLAQVLSAKKVGLLSTHGTYFSGIYDKALETHHILSIVPPTEKEKEEVHAAIYDPNYGIKSISDPIQAEAVRILQHYGEYLIGEGAEAIILGCTEISLARSLLQFPVPMVDPLEVLAQHLLHAAGFMVDLTHRQE